MNRIVDRSSRGPGVVWPSVAVFYILACLISWPVFWWRDRIPTSWASWDAPGFVKALLPALGPAIASLVALVSFRSVHIRAINLLGTSWRRSVLFMLTPISLLGLLGVGDDQPHLTGLWWGSCCGLGLGEELG